MLLLNRAAENMQVQYIYLDQYVDLFLLFFCTSLSNKDVHIISGGPIRSQP